MLSSICIVQILTATAIAASCWRDTPCVGPSRTPFPGQWESNIFAPASRTLIPKSVLSLPLGDFVSNYKAGSDIFLQTNDGQGVVFDFGLEVGGIVTINYTLHGPSATLGLAFTEGKQWIGRKSDNSNGGSGADGALVTNITSAGRGSYIMGDTHLRGGFRYLTVFSDAPADTTIEINGINLELSFQPTWSDLRAYQGYFHSNDELLNKIWYAGAYTLQSNTAPANTCRHNTNLKSGWLNDVTCGLGDTVLLDGAKRDRWVWIGDMGVAVPSSFVSTGDMESTKNALQVIWSNQLASGALPKAGPPYLSSDSDTYHMWTMIGTYNYILYTKDYEFLTQNWPRYLKAMKFVHDKVTPAGIMNATGQGDWGRWTYNTQASSASMLLYRTLRTGAALTSWAPELLETNITAEYTEKADQLQVAIIDQFWNDTRGAFKDSSSNISLYPQDANSMAIAFSVVPPKSNYAKRVSDYLANNWTPIGPICPELPKNVSPFISSIEVEGHFQAGRPDRALELMRTLWGWYLGNPNGTESTVIEGYLLDGTFGYRGDRGYRNDPSYTSHAHGWSSGPTFALTEYIVGLSVTKPGGEEWELTPATFTHLTTAEAGFTTSLGKFSAKFKVEKKKVTVVWDTPHGTKGWVALPGKKTQWVKGGKGTVVIRID